MHETSEASGRPFPGDMIGVRYMVDDVRRWSLIASLIALAVLTEAFFAGAMLSGVYWARNAHAVGAGILIAATLIAGTVAIITHRRISRGAKLGWILLALATTILIQAAVGVLSAKGANLLWLHVPLGVALFGFAARAAAHAGRLGSE